jgi:hypothetical protein
VKANLHESSLRKHGCIEKNEEHTDSLFGPADCHQS